MSDQPAEMGVVVALMTAPSVEVAAGIVRTVVDEGLAACGNIVPGVRSIYRWQGKIHDEPEVLVVFKLPAEQAEALKARIIELHPYDVPEFLVLGVAAGHAPYLEWVRRLGG